MAEIQANISGGTPPYSIVVRKIGESTGNRCTGGCNSFPVSFNEDNGNNEYYFIATDSSSPVCIVDSRVINGGVSNVNCDVVQPSFDALLIQPTCSVSGYNNGVLQLTNIVGATRYKICYNTVSMSCAACTASDGVISGSSLNINLTTPNFPTNTGVLIRLYADSTCDSYKEWFGTMVTPTCEGQETPDFQVQEIQPYCSSEFNGTVQNAVLKVRNITNATRYKVCYNTNVFNCTNCNVSDGLLSGNSVDISISAPSAGLSQSVTVRFYNESGCEIYKDHSFTIHSPDCSSNEFTMMNLDLQVFQARSNSPSDTNAKCDQPSTYHVEYDFYITPNTVGMTENGIQVRTTGGSQRTLPNGNDVPNVLVAAGYKGLCGNTPTNQAGTPGSIMPTLFYRFTWNMSRLRSKYPNINEFTFDVFANKTKDDGAAINPNMIYPYLNGFFGVTVIKQLYSNNAHDAFRSPFYNGTACSPNGCADTYNVYTNTAITPVTYKTTISGSRKIGTIKYNYSTKQATWIEVSQ